MKALAVARFTLLRLVRRQYLWAGLVLIVLAVVTFLLKKTDLYLPHYLGARFIWLMAVWLGVNLVHADRADGLLTSTLTRPISLFEVLLGKALGGGAALLLYAAAVTAALAMAGLLRGVPPSGAALIFQFLWLPLSFVYLLLAMVLAQWLPRVLAAALALLAWPSFFSAHAQAGLLDWFPAWTMKILSPFMDVLFWLCPRTETATLSIREIAAGKWEWLPALLLWPYALHVMLVACLAAAWLLNRKEL